MQRGPMVLFLIICTFFISPSFAAEKTDTEPTLAIQFTSSSPYIYQEDDGTTVVIGEVKNVKNFPITGVQIRAAFFDDFNPQPLEATLGTTVLEVIPPQSTSPYIIRSPNPNTAITNVEVNLQGFHSAGPKQTGLEIKVESLEISDRINFSGILINNGLGITGQTVINLIFYDSFEPPRLIGIESKTLENLEIGGTSNFEFDVNRNPKAAGFKVMVDSKNFYPSITDLPITPPETLTKLVTIKDVHLTDTLGNRISDIKSNSPILLQSSLSIQYGLNQETPDQPFVYYTQIKQSGEKAFVEYIGFSEGIFEGPGSKIPTVEWTPKNPGLYFVETFVWDPSGIPIAAKGPIILTLVN